MARNSKPNKNDLYDFICDIMNLHTDTSRKMMSCHWHLGSTNVLIGMGLDIGDLKRAVRYHTGSGPLLFLLFCFFPLLLLLRLIFSLFFLNFLSFLCILLVSIFFCAYLLRLEE